MLNRIIDLLSLLLNPSLRKHRWAARHLARLRRFKDTIHETGYTQGFQEAQFSVGDWNKPL